MAVTSGRGWTLEEQQRSERLSKQSTLGDKLDQLGALSSIEPSFADDRSTYMKRKAEFEAVDAAHLDLDKSKLQEHAEAIVNSCIPERKKARKQLLAAQKAAAAAAAIAEQASIEAENAKAAYENASEGPAFDLDFKDE